MSLDCLRTAVQLRGCGANSPAPLLFVNALQGISLKGFEFLADAEQQTYVGVWSDIQTRAIERIRLAAQAALNSRYRLKTSSNTYDLGRNIDTTTMTASASEYRGVEFDMNKGVSSLYKHSALSSHWVQSVSIYSGSSYTTTLKILDAELETELYSRSSDLVAGWNSIPVNDHFDANRIVVAFNASTEGSVKLEIPSTIKYAYDGVSISGGYYTTASGISSWVETDNSYGLSVKYALRCRYDNLICSNVDLFAVPYWYLCGAEYMIERLTSERVNKFTVDRKQAEENLMWYEDKFKDTLKLAVDGIDLCHDSCVDCGGMYQIIESLP
jgi:hypothetical protein